METLARLQRVSGHVIVTPGVEPLTPCDGGGHACRRRELSRHRATAAYDVHIRGRR